MLPYIASYVSALLVFFLIDIVWITSVMQPIFQRQVGSFLLERPRKGAAALFYALYVAGIIYFAVVPAYESGAWWIAAVNGALIGFLSYGTYEVTNLATLKGWNYRMLAVDVAWGMLLTAVTALVAYAVIDRMTV